MITPDDTTLALIAGTIASMEKNTDDPTKHRAIAVSSVALARAIIEEVQGTAPVSITEKDKPHGPR